LNRESITVLAGTDFHGSKSAFENIAAKARIHGADLIVVCGDITNFGTREEAEKLLRILAGTQLPTIFVPGNCDPPTLTEIELDRVKCIHGSGVSYGNLTFIGVGGSPITPFNTFFEMSEDEIMRVIEGCVRRLGGDLAGQIILVSHSPPKNTRVDRTFAGMHVGSTSVRAFIERYRPRLTICGHIHEARGKDYIDGSLIVNPGPARHGNYAVIQIDANNISVDLKP